MSGDILNCNLVRKPSFSCWCLTDQRYQ